MRRFKSLLHPVVSATVAFATIAVATLFATSRDALHHADAAGDASGSASRTPGGWRPRGIHVVPLLAVLVIGATAFATGAGTQDRADAVAVGEQIPHATLATSTSAAETTLPATAESIASAVEAKAAARVRFMKAIAKNKAEAAHAAAVAEAHAKAAAEKARAEAAARAKAEAAAAAQAPASVSGACGGNLPPCCVMMRESGGNPTVVNASSGASGKWQFMTSTWAGYGGYPTAASAPEWVQDQRAAQVWAGGAGAGHWGGGC